MKGSVTYSPKRIHGDEHFCSKWTENQLQNPSKYKCAPYTHQSSPLNLGLFLLLMLKFLKAQDVRSVRTDEVEHAHVYSLRLIRSLVFPEADLLSIIKSKQRLLSH